MPAGNGNVVKWEHSVDIFLVSGRCIQCDDAIGLVLACISRVGHVETFQRGTAQASPETDGNCDHELLGKAIHRCYC